MTTSNKSTIAPSSTMSQQLRNLPMIQDFHLVWLNGSTDTVDVNHSDNFTTELAPIFDTINTFIDADECLDFITDVTQKDFRDYIG